MTAVAVARGARPRTPRICAGLRPVSRRELRRLKHASRSAEFPCLTCQRLIATAEALLVALRAKHTEEEG